MTNFFGQPARLRIHPSDRLESVPVDYVGLSMETLQLAEPAYFSPSNTELIALFRRLSERGVLRLVCVVVTAQQVQACAADYMLQMASLGCGGIHFHGGAGRPISTSLGGKLPGARNAADLEIAKLGSFYSPIAGTLEASFTPRPLFYGMMLAAQLAGTTLVRTEFDCGGLNATAYCGSDGTEYRVALFNKDDVVDLAVSIAIHGGQAASEAQIWRLSAASLHATDGITLAGAEIGRHGAWQPEQVEKVEPRTATLTIDLPRAIAILASFR